MSNDAARERYLAEYQNFEAAGVSLEESLKSFLATVGVRAHVEVRAKSVGSFVKKIHVNDYTDPWTEITDKLGGRIIVKTLDDLDVVRRAFEGEIPPLPVLWIEDKSAKADVGTLFYPGSPPMAEPSSARFRSEPRPKTSGQCLRTSSSTRGS
jgi:hypothetical protein